MKLNSPNICPRCGAAFSCGMDAGQEPCWCTKLPPLAVKLPDGGCYCPACLELLVAAQQRNQANF